MVKILANTLTLLIVINVAAYGRSRGKPQVALENSAIENLIRGKFDTSGYTKQCETYYDDLKDDGKLKGSTKANLISMQVKSSTKPGRTVDIRSLSHYGKTDGDPFRFEDFYHNQVQEIDDTDYGIKDSNFFERDPKKQFVNYCKSNLASWKEGKKHFDLDDYIKKDVNEKKKENSDELAFIVNRTSSCCNHRICTVKDANSKKTCDPTADTVEKVDGLLEFVPFLSHMLPRHGNRIIRRGTKKYCDTCYGKAFPRKDDKEKFRDLRKRLLKIAKGNVQANRIANSLDKLAKFNENAYAQMSMNRFFVSETGELSEEDKKRFTCSDYKALEEKLNTKCKNNKKKIDQGLEKSYRSKLMNQVSSVKQLKNYMTDFEKDANFCTTKARHALFKASNFYHDKNLSDSAFALLDLAFMKSRLNREGETEGCYNDSTDSATDALIYELNKRLPQELEKKSKLARLLSSYGIDKNNYKSKVKKIMGLAASMEPNLGFLMSHKHNLCTALKYDGPDTYKNTRSLLTNTEEPMDIYRRSAEKIFHRLRATNVVCTEIFDEIADNICAEPEDINPTDEELEQVVNEMQASMSSEEAKQTKDYIFFKVATNSVACEIAGNPKKDKKVQKDHSLTELINLETDLIKEDDGKFGPISYKATEDVNNPKLNKALRDNPNSCIGLNTSSDALFIFGMQGQLGILKHFVETNRQKNQRTDIEIGPDYIDRDDSQSTVSSSSQITSHAQNALKKANKIKDEIIAEEIRQDRGADSNSAPVQLDPFADEYDEYDEYDLGFPSEDKDSDGDGIADRIQNNPEKYSEFCATIGVDCKFNENSNEDQTVQTVSSVSTSSEEAVTKVNQKASEFSFKGNPEDPSFNEFEKEGFNVFRDEQYIAGPRNPYTKEYGIDRSVSKGQLDRILAQDGQTKDKYNAIRRALAESGIDESIMKDYISNMTKDEREALEQQIKEKEKDDPKLAQVQKQLEELQKQITAKGIVEKTTGKDSELDKKLKKANDRIKELETKLATVKPRRSNRSFASEAIARTNTEKQAGNGQVGNGSDRALSRKSNFYGSGSSGGEYISTASRSKSVVKSLPSTYLTDIAKDESRIRIQADSVKLPSGNTASNFRLVVEADWWTKEQEITSESFKVKEDGLYVEFGGEEISLEKLKEKLTPEEIAMLEALQEKAILEKDVVPKLKKVKRAVASVVEESSRDGKASDREISYEMLIQALGQN